MAEFEEGYLNGEVVFKIYENIDNHFSIIKVKIEETNETFDEKEIIVKGNFVHLQKGMTYQFRGELTKHPRFGLQYNAKSYETFIPKTKSALISYLSSDLFEGVGQKSATYIVEHLGENAIDIILKDPQKLDATPKVSNKIKKALLAQLQDNQGFEKIAIELTKYGISLKKAQEIYDKYKLETLKIIQDNPYQFVYDIEGVSFLTADRIAFSYGMSRLDSKRIHASCIYALQSSSLDGHVYIPVNQCIQGMFDVLKEADITESICLNAINTLAEEKHIVKVDDKLYLPSLYYAEKHFTEKLKNILELKVDFNRTDAELLKVIGEIEQDEAISYGEEQFEAIQKALKSKVMILTGGPGTGKTTVIKGIIAAYGKLYDLSLDKRDYKQKSDFPFILTAPTGRAAKRMKESTQIEAYTIHRLLGWDGNQSFEKNEYDQLAGKLLIIDEFSMVDTWLANHLFKAIPDDMQVLIVGDEDQLPSVGPGQVLADLFNSQALPTVTLSEVYRQKEGSKIIQLAHEIKQNVCDVRQLGKASDFNFIDCDANQVLDMIEMIVKRAIEKGLNPDNIQILAPMYRSKAGIHEINQRLQTLINPYKETKRERQFNDMVFRVGDRVLQLVNQPEDGVYNGDIGKIVQIFRAKETEDKQEQLIVEFDDTEVAYPRNHFIHLTHAYCISIHKAQGSEFPIVILPVIHNYRRMLKKNLLYTAITRSQNSLIMCGERMAFKEGIERVHTDQRYTSLTKNLLRKLEMLNEESTAEDDTKSIVTDAILNLEVSNVGADISPYDFM